VPMPQSHYPPGWTEFSLFIRLTRAHGRCECTGQCGLHQHPTHTRRCIELNHRAAHFAHGKVILTVAHLCDCNPICLNPAHVIAACQRCHLRIDRFKHAVHRLANQSTSKRLATDIQAAAGPLHGKSLRNTN
jgi:hypothetical protein